MSSLTYRHSRPRSLFQIKWTYKNVKLFLENDSSSINEMKSGYTPLLRALRYKFPIDFIKLLLDYGANVNCTDKKAHKYNHTPLHLALMCIRKVEYINLLLERGADVNAVTGTGRSLYCFALKHFHSAEIIQRLLDAGCLHNVCKYHDDSALNCVIHNSTPTWGPFAFQKILQLLMERSVNMKAINKSGESVLCLGLSKGIPASYVEALLAEGSQLHCTQHTNPFLCVASGTNTELKVDVVQLLLNRGACMNFDILKCAIKNCRCDTKTITLLLEQGVDINAVDNESNDTLLHFAVRRVAVTLSVLKLLIKRGVPVDVVNKQGNTALHEAIKSEGYLGSASVVKTLLECGSDVNALNESFDTPLHVAISHASDADTFKLLFAYGARIREDRYSLLKSRFDGYDDAQEISKDFCEVLVKGYLLEFGCHGVGDLIQRIVYNDKTFMTFVFNCIYELKEKSSQIVAEGRTLREFLIGKSLFQKGHGIVCERAFFNQLLRVLAENDFPMFFDNISAKVGRSPMEIKLQELQLYAVKYRDVAPTKENVVLNNDILYNIASFLTDEDLLRFLCASYKTNDHFCARKSSKAKAHGNKRSYEQSELCRKHPKL